MKLSILPLSSVPAELARAFLLRKGFREEIIRWKYFDAEFNRGRERAFVWLDRDTVKGFIGLIPFELGFPDQRRNMVWTCDWWVEDPMKNPGIGVMLLKKVYSSFDYVGGVGGTEYTQAILPRMASCTVQDAAVFLHLPLRLGYLLEKLEARAPRLPKLSRTFMKGFSLRFPTSDVSPAVRTEEGVSKDFGRLLSDPTVERPQPLYDHAYIDWQVGRCPGTRCFSSIYGTPNSPEAGAVFWSDRREPQHWKIALRARSGSLSRLDQVLAEVVRKVHGEKGAALSTIISHLDTPMLFFLKGRGFIKGPVQWPLYLSSRDQGGPQLRDLANLSYLDTDLAASF